jgi:chromosome segregation ATPase
MHDAAARRRVVKGFSSLLVGGVAVVAAFFAYQQVRYGGLGITVGRHEERLKDLSEQTATHGKELARHEGRIQETGAKVKEHEIRIEELAEEVAAAKERLAAAEKTLEEAMAQGEASQRALEKLGNRVAELREVHEVLVRDYDQRAQEIHLLKQRLDKQEQLDRDVDRRLRELEKRAGIGPVTP